MISYSAPITDNARDFPAGRQQTLCRARPDLKTAHVPALPAADRSATMLGHPGRTLQVVDYPKLSISLTRASKQRKFHRVTRIQGGGPGQVRALMAPICRA